MSPTPKYGHPPIKMRRTGPGLFGQNVVPLAERLKAAGDFYWAKGRGGRTLVLAIPRLGPDRALAWVLSAWTIDHKNSVGCSWSWNVDEDFPTLSPSLHAKGVWHGFVRAGFLVEA